MARTTRRSKQADRIQRTGKALERWWVSCKVDSAYKKKNCLRLEEMAGDRVDDAWHEWDNGDYDRSAVEIRLAEKLTRKLFACCGLRSPYLRRKRIRR